MSSQIHEIIIGLDPGTRNMRIAAQLLRGDNTSAKTTPIDDIYLEVCEGIKNPEIKQIAVFMPNGAGGHDIVFGAPVHGLLQLHPHMQREVLEFFKLALHQDFDNFREAAHVKEVLKTDIDHGKLQDFFADLIEAVVKGVRAYYKRTLKANAATAAAIDAAPVTMQLCVPAMWEDKQLGIMRNAATDAGVAKVELREEPLCSAVMCTHKLLNDPDRDISVGQCSLVVDCGSGTLDISVTRLEEIPSGDQEMVLSRIGICSGNSAGSQMLNHKLSTYIASGKCPGISNFKEFSTEMGLTEYEFLRQASKEFDTVKEKFPSHVLFYGLNIYGHDGTQPVFRTIHLSHQLIEKWYDLWIAKATQLLRDHIEHITEWAKQHGVNLNLTFATFLGGGMDCRLLSDAMEKVLQDSHYDIEVVYERKRLPCARGALLHRTFQQDTLPSRMRFFVGREEYYQEEVHGDNSKRGQSKWFKRTRILAPDHVARIMDLDNGVASNQKMVPMEFFVADGERAGRLEVSLLWTENEVEDHAPFKTRAGKLPKGVRSFPLVLADLPDLSEHGFKAVDRQGFAGRYFVVRCWVGLEYRDEKLVLIVKVMRSGYRHPWKADGKLRLKSRTNKARRKVPLTVADLARKDVFKTRTRVVWTKDSSHFITNSTGTCISRGDHIQEDLEYHFDYRTEEAMDEDMEDSAGEDGEESEEEDEEDEAGDMDEAMEEDMAGDMDEEMEQGAAGVSGGVIDLTMDTDYSEEDED